MEHFIAILVLNIVLQQFKVGKSSKLGGKPVSLKRCTISQESVSPISLNYSAIVVFLVSFNM